MILNFIIQVIFTLITTILGVLPNIPAIPTAISNGGTYISDTIATFVSFINIFFSPALVSATIVVAIGLFTWEWFYGLALWIIKKIPIVNIK